MLVQLSGVPGAGKSRLARSIAGASDLVVLDTDVLKSSIIHSRVPIAAAGAVTYAATLALAQDLLEQGRDVLLDSPCRYQELLDSGQQIARAHGVRYAFIELWVQDWTTVLARLDARSPMSSQVSSATAPVPGTVWEFGTAEETLASWQTQLVRPEHDWLRLDAENAADQNLSAALRYLDPRRQRETEGPDLRDSDAPSRGPGFESLPGCEDVAGDHLAPGDLD